MKRTAFRKAFKVLFFLMVFQSFQVSSLFAQCDATLASTSSSIELNGTDLCEDWTIDISDLGFTSEDHAVKFFRMNTDNISVYEVNWAEQKVNLKLMVAYQPTWGLAEWNTYYTTYPMDPM